MYNINLKAKSEKLPEYLLKLLGQGTSGSKFKVSVQQSSVRLKLEGNMDVYGNLTKSSGSFKIDHPLDPDNKYLCHSFVESPDMKNIYDGIIVTNNEGLATVTLPEYFGALNKDFRYQLTCIGAFAEAIIFKEIINNRFTIKTNIPNIKVSWQVTGTRKDPYAENNRIQVEIEKSKNERNKYIYTDYYEKTSN